MDSENPINDTRREAKDVSVLPETGQMAKQSAIPIKRIEVALIHDQSDQIKYCVRFVLTKNNCRSLGSEVGKILIESSLAHLS